MPHAEKSTVRLPDLLPSQISVLGVTSKARNHIFKDTIVSRFSLNAYQFKMHHSEATSHRLKTR